MSDPIADRLAIADVIVQYATSVDARDMDRYADCFTDDIVVTGFGKGEYHGKPDYLAFVNDALSRFGATQHLIGNFEITIDGDTAHMRSYVQATHVLAADESTLVVLWGVYVDDLRRTDRGWKICRHHLDRQISPRRISAPA